MDGYCGGLGRQSLPVDTLEYGRGKVLEVRRIGVREAVGPGIYASVPLVQWQKFRIDCCMQTPPDFHLYSTNER